MTLTSQMPAPHVPQVSDVGQRILSYRWGYFQGFVLIPFTLLIFLGISSVYLIGTEKPEPWFLAWPVLMIAAIGMPLAFGLLWRKRFALPLVKLMLALWLIRLATKVPVAVTHFADGTDLGSAIAEAEMALLWLCSFFYYRKREHMFS